MTTCVALGANLFGECSTNEHVWVAVDGGESFSMGVTQDSEVVGWGSAFYGEFGEQDDGCSSRPATTIRMPIKCSSLACGISHVLALSEDGEVFAWGRNAHGEIAQSPSTIPISSRPTKVEFSSTNPLTVVSLAAGGSHSLALDSTGMVWSWGNNTYGQLGIGTTSDIECAPKMINSSVAVRVIAAGCVHSALVACDGRVYTFGWGLYHQLGHGATENCVFPTLVDALDGIDGGMSSVACGTWHTAAISSQGDVYTWGWGPDGQLGPSQGSSASFPSVVDTDDEYFSRDDEQHRALRVACGARFTAVVSRNGDLFCWGRNGASMTSSIASPSSIRSVAAGNSHVLVLVDK